MITDKQYYYYLKFLPEQVKREHGKFYQKENPKKMPTTTKNESDPASNCRPKPTTLQTTSTNPVDESNISSSPPIVKANPHESDAIHRFINEKAKQQVTTPISMTTVPKS